MVTPVTLLAVFCAALAAVSIVRLVTAEDRTRVEAGTVAVVVGITALAALSAAVDHSASVHVRLALGIAGVGLIVAGATVIVRFWNG